MEQRKGVGVVLILAASFGSYLVAEVKGVLGQHAGPSYLENCTFFSGVVIIP